MRNFWNNYIVNYWNAHVVSHHQVRGQTYWIFHLKTDNLHISPVKYMRIEVIQSDLLTNTTNGSQAKVKFLGKCRKKALLDWREHLVKLKTELSIRHKCARIYLGEEFIFNRRRGWRLNRYSSIKILKRFWTIKLSHDG